MTSAAQEFFSVVVVCEDLKGKDVFAVLCDDSQNQGAKNTFTFVIFIDNKIRTIENGRIEALFFLILAHEICHFVFYYELFLNLGGDRSSNVYDKFRHTIFGTFEDGISPAKKAANRIDEHNIAELVYMFGKYPREHFANKNKTDINYYGFFFHFLEHLKFGKLLQQGS